MALGHAAVFPLTCYALSPGHGAGNAIGLSRKLSAAEPPPPLPPNKFAIIFLSRDAMPARYIAIVV